MLDPRTAEQLLAHAQGPAVDFLFNHAASLECGIVAAPSSELVLSKWNHLSVDDACDLIAVLTDTVVLDRIAERDRRRRVRRALAMNPYLHTVTRLFLLQSALNENDEETAARALDRFPADHLVEMHGTDPSLPFTNPLIARALAECADIEAAAAKVREPGGESLVVLLLRFDVMFAIDVVERAGLEWSKMQRRYAGRPVATRDLTVGELRRVIAALGDDTGVAYACALVDDDLGKMLDVDRRVIAHALASLDVVDADVATFCIDHDLVSDLRFDLVRFTDHAIERLIDAGAWKANPAVLLHHPDKHKVLAMVGQSINEVLVGVASSGSSSLAGEWLGSMASSFSSDVFWDLAVQASLRVDRRFGQAIPPGTDIAALFNAAPVDALVLMDVLPAGTDLPAMLARSSDLEPMLRQQVILLVLAAAREEESPFLESVVDALVLSFSDAALTSWLQAHGHARPTRTEIEALAHRHPEVVARLSERPGMIGRTIPMTEEVVAVMRPSVGWGEVVVRDGAEAVLSVLTSLIGDDVSLWEPTLAMFDAWVGSLEDLVAAARTV